MDPFSAGFLAWAEHPGHEGDPRPLAEVDGVEPVGVPDWGPSFAGGAPEALCFLRDALIHDDRPRRILVNGGDSPSLMAAVDSGFRRMGDELLILPPTQDGLPHPEALVMALRGGRMPSSLVMGASSPTGVLAPLQELQELLEAYQAVLVLESTLARWTRQAFSIRGTNLGWIWALDRWDGAAPGTWTAALGTAPPPALGTPEDRFLHLDAALWGAVSAEPGLILWPRTANRRVVGILSLGIPGQDPHEVAAVLKGSFGLTVGSGKMTAVPLPLPDSPGFIRVSLGPATTPDELDHLASALGRVCRSLSLPGRMH